MDLAAGADPAARAAVPDIIIPADLAADTVCRLPGHPEGPILAVAGTVRTAAEAAAAACCP